MRVAPLFALLTFTVGTSSAAQPDLAAHGAYVLRSPTERDMRRYYPRQALRLNIDGRVKLDCRVKFDGLGSCRAVEETPSGLGFGEAAVRLSATFQFRPAVKWGAPVDGDWRAIIKFKHADQPPKTADRS